MDTKSTIIGVIIALICCIPFVMFYFIKRKQKHILIDNLNETAKINNAEINEYEIFNNSIIAIDKNKQLAFFVKNSQSTIVDLINIQYCYLDINKKGNKDILISADICFKQLSNKESKFNIYNEETDPPLNGELLFSEIWVNTFNQKIKKAA
jgi:hypothetical protein